MNGCAFFCFAHFQYGVAAQKSSTASLWIIRDIDAFYGLYIQYILLFQTIGIMSTL